MLNDIVKNKFFILSIIFAIIQLSLLSIILFVKDYSYIFCFLLVIISASFGIVFSLDKKHNLFIILALIFTVIADYFLVIRFENTRDLFHQSTGMTIFIGTQTCYFLFLLFSCENKKLKNINIVSRIVLPLLVLIVALIVLKKNINYLIIVALIYFSFIILNVIFAFIEYKKTNLLFAIGLVFFMLCDIVIGLTVAFNGIIEVNHESFIYKFVFSPFNFTWLFYGISQILIPLSIAYNKNLK